MSVLALGQHFGRRVFAAPLPQAMQGVTDIDPHKAFGSKNAPIIMEVFSDFQCPACKTLYTSTNRLIIDNYVNTGQIYHLNQTPTTILHAKGQTYPVVGVVSYDILHNFLDQLLSQ